MEQSWQCNDRGADGKARYPTEIALPVAGKMPCGKRQHRDNAQFRQNEPHPYNSDCQRQVARRKFKQTGYPAPQTRLSGDCRVDGTVRQAGQCQQQTEYQKLGLDVFP